MNSLDTIYPFEIYARAEEIFNNNGVKEISSSGNIYNLIIYEEASYEVELISPFTKKFKSSCTCSYFQQHKYCVHTVSALIYLKNKLDIPQTRPGSTKPKKLSLSDLLDQVPQGELLKFIKSYGAKDKKLNLALKVHFAKYITLDDNSTKYKSILQSVVKPITSSNQKISQSEWIGIRSICKDLLDQTEDLLVMNGAFEALDIILTVITKLSYIQTAYQKNSSDLTELLTAYHQTLANIHSEYNSLKLTTKYKEVLMELINTSYYQLTTPLYNAGELLYKHGLIEKSALSEYLKNKATSSKNENELYLVYSLWIRLTGKDFDYTTIPTAHLVFLEKIADDLTLHKEDSLAIKLLYHFHNEKVRNPLTLKITKILLRDNQLDKLKELSLLFIKTRDLRIIDYINSHHKDIKESFNQEVFSSPDFDELMNSIAYPYYLNKIGKIDLLLEYLTNIRNFDLIKNFDADINKVRPIPLALLYTHMVDDYLTNHIGENSTAFVEQIIEHLEKIKAKDSVKHIRHLIKENYGHRSGFQ